jgi:hypothetical protein
VWIRIALAVTIPVYLGIVAVRGDVMAAGQSDRGLAAMVAAHYFEHALDYLLVALLVLGGVGLRVARPDDPGIARDPADAVAGSARHLSPGS